MVPPSYAVITPARDEAGFIEETLKSVTSQTSPPQVYIVVDDGSTDQTPEIVQRYAADYPFVKLLRPSQDAGEVGDRLSWAAEVVAFNTGLATLRLDDYDYIVKLDADLRFEPDYFERLFTEFDADPLLGIAGGQLYEMHGGRLVLDRVPDWHVRGATKVYRRQCFADIGGLVTILGWDGVDETKAYLTGWRSRSFLEPSCVHLRPQGESGGGLLHGRARLGLASYLLRYHPLWVLVRSTRLAMKEPRVVGGLAYILGYLQGVARRPTRLQDRAVSSYMRRSQMQRLVGIRPYSLPDDIDSETR